MLTIIVITFNRPRHLSRLLNYFYGLNVSHPIYIADASEPVHLERNKETINSLSRGLNLRHLVWDSSAGFYEVLFGCLEQVDTRYVALVADDDFIVPPTLDVIVEFMNNNPSYEAAHGKQIMFMFPAMSDGPYSTSLSTSRLIMVDCSVEGTTAADRIRKRICQNTRFSAPKTTFAVMKTSNVLRLYREVLALGLDASNTEGLVYHMVLLSGNIKLIDRLYLIRQYHRSQGAYRTHGLYVPIITQSSSGVSYEPLQDMHRREKRLRAPDFFDQLVDPLFHVKYERMISCLASELSRQDGINIEESRKIIKHWQWYFLAKNMMPKFYEHGGDHVIGIRSASVSTRARRWARQIPGVRRMWEKLRSRSDEMSLSRLLRPNSTFHVDFLPIYRAITGASPGNHQSGEN